MIKGDIIINHLIDKNNPMRIGIITNIDKQFTTFLYEDNDELHQVTAYTSELKDISDIISHFDYEKSIKSILQTLKGNSLKK